MSKHSIIIIKNDRIQKINSDIVEYICYNINT